MSEKDRSLNCNSPDELEVSALKARLELARERQDDATTRLADAVISWAKAVSQFSRTVDGVAEKNKAVGGG